MALTAVPSASLEALLRRVEEVRGLSPEAGSSRPAAAEASDSLLHVIDELVVELERSHRRLIEANVQLVSLREVASRLLGAHDVFETTRLVTRYLCHAYGFSDGFLLLVQRDAGRLQGTWNHLVDGKDHGTRLDLPLQGDGGTVAQALWLNRTLVHRRPRRHVPAVLPTDHPLRASFDHLDSTVSVPLFRSQSVLPMAESHELCGARCILGDPGLLAPPPGASSAGWSSARDERQQHCLRCEVFPLLGVIGMARRHERGPVGAADVMLLESIGQSVAPMVENARLVQELRRGERFRNHVLDSMTGSLLAVNMRGDILTSNRAAQSLLVATESEIQGQPFGSWFGKDAESALRATLDRGQEVQGFETILPVRDDRMIPIRLSTSLLRDERRVVYGAIVTFVDLTPIRQAEERARQVDRLATLGRFTSSVAHEIRNPLTGIGTGVQCLARAIPAGDPQHENLRFIQHEIHRLDGIVQDLFNATHQRRLELVVAPVEDTLERAVRCVSPLFERGDVALEIAATPGLPPVAHDSHQLEQVFINLLKNAVEASAGGTKVCVRLFTSGPAGPATRPVVAPPTPATLTVAVEDQGCGIPAEALTTLFEPFFTTKRSGTGLGLYVCHDIVKRHGGQLAVDSEPGRGSRFILELPVVPHGGTP